MIKTANQIISEDEIMTARRFVDARRYAADKWNKTHADPIDEGQVALFIADERHGVLTEEQKEFVRACRDDMHNVYNDMMIHLLQYYEMKRRGMVSDLMSFCQVYLPGNPRCA